MVAASVFITLVYLAVAPVLIYLSGPRRLIRLPKVPVTIGSMIRWWESRRTLFSIFIGFLVLLDLVTMFGGNSDQCLSGVEGEDDGIGVVLVALLFVFLANIVFTVGWVLEGIARFGFKVKSGECSVFFIAGVCLTTIVTFFVMLNCDRCSFFEECFARLLFALLWIFVEIGFVLHFFTRFW